MRDEFLASVSHDLRTPLTAIKAYAQIAHRRASRLEPAAATRLVDLLTGIDLAATKMTALVEELLDLTRLETGRPLELRREVTDLVTLARACIADHQRTSQVHHLHLETPEREVSGCWDAARLERVLSNLLSNAIKYSDGGDITVTVAREPAPAPGSRACRAEAGRADVPMSCPPAAHRPPEADGASGWAVLTVHDDGVGIPAADLPHIFERFYRAGNAGRAWGSGIGLAGARQIVEQHGGTVTVESNEGEGATFTVRLPIA